MSADSRSKRSMQGKLVLVPRARTRKIRWAETALRGRDERSRVPFKNLHFVHSDCACGSVDCLGYSFPLR